MPSPKTELRIINAIHCVQIVLAGAALGIGLYKMFFSKDKAAARTGRWALSVAAKSLVIISYQLMTENIKALHRYASLKAFLILDVLEVGFWIAAIALTVMGMVKTCTGLNCTLSGVVIGLAVILAILGLPLVWIAFKHWQYYKRNGHRIEDCSEGNAQSPGNVKTQFLEAGQTPSSGSEFTHGGVSYPMRKTSGNGV